MTRDLLTAEDLLNLHVPNKRTELVRGRLVIRERAGLRHGVVTTELARRLSEFVRSHALGLVVAADTGFKLSGNPDTVRAPDVAFIRASRVPNPLPHGYAAIAPDLAVEVLSPADRASDVLAKVADWLSAGCELVWVVDPERRVARVYRADGTESFVSANDSLEGEQVLAGLVCSLGDIL